MGMTVPTYRIATQGLNVDPILLTPPPPPPPLPSPLPLLLVLLLIIIIIAITILHGMACSQ